MSTDITADLTLLSAFTVCSVTDESDDAMSVSAEEARESAGNTTNTCPALKPLFH